MKTIVLYTSLTGITKQIAQAVTQGLPEGTQCLPIQDVPKDIASYDCVFLGFCLAEGHGEGPVQDVLHNLHNAHIVPFITLENSDPFSNQSSVELRRIIENLPPGSTVSGTYVTHIKSRENPDLHLDFAKEFAAGTWERIQNID